MRHRCQDSHTCEWLFDACRQLKINSQSINVLHNLKAIANITDLLNFPTINCVSIIHAVPNVFWSWRAFQQRVLSRERVGAVGIIITAAFVALQSIDTCKYFLCNQPNFNTNLLYCTYTISENLAHKAEKIQRTS